MNSHEKMSKVAHVACGAFTSILLLACPNQGAKEPAETEADFSCEIRTFHIQPTAKICTVNEEVGEKMVAVKPEGPADNQYIPIKLRSDRCTITEFTHTEGDDLMAPPPADAEFPRFPFYRFPRNPAPTTTASFSPSTGAEYHYAADPETPPCPIKITVKPPDVKK